MPGGRASFGFDVQRQNTGDAPDGALSYNNNPRGLTVQATQIRTFDIVDDTATLSGDCTKTYDGNTWIDCTFSVSVRDNDNPPQFVGGVESGRGWDSFTIQVSDEPTEGGTLLRGTIDNQ